MDDQREEYTNKPADSLLILDSARCHLTDNVRKFYKEHTKVAVIPAGMTKYLQPLDVGINKPFKDNLKRGWKAWMNDTTKAQYTKSGIRKRMSYGEVAQLVSESFYSISQQTIQNSFRKALDENSVIDDMFASFDNLQVFVGDSDS